jgi:HSP20 family protein
MTLYHSDPSRDVAAHHERMSRMLEEFYGCSEEALARGSWVPAVDIYSNGQHELVLKAELPDMKEEAIELTVKGHTLTLLGERKLDMDVTEEQFHRIERSYGSFTRTFTLPPTVDVGHVSAEYKDPHADGAAARGSQAEADQGPSRRVTSLQRGGVE